jgi:uncharacterized protein (UPF0335 family)
MNVHITKGDVAGLELQQFVERVERLEEDKKAISGDIRDVYAELNNYRLAPVGSCERIY